MLSSQDKAAISSDLVQFQAGSERALNQLVPLTQGFLEQEAKCLILKNRALQPKDVVQQMWTNLADPARVQALFSPASTSPTLYLTRQLQHAADELRRMLAPTGVKTADSRQQDTNFRTVQLSELPKQCKALSVEADALAAIDRKIWMRYLYRRDKTLARVLRTMKHRGLSVDQATHYLALSRYVVRRKLVWLRAKLK